MSFKTDLLNTYRLYTNKLTDTIQQIEEVTASRSYTISGQQERIEEINKVFLDGATTLRSRALGTIDQAEQSYLAIKKLNAADTLKNGDYQAGLSNVLKILENGTMDQGDFTNIIDVYKNDSIALQAIKTVVMNNSKAHDLMGFIPSTDQDQTSAFNMLRKNTKKYTTAIAINNKYGLKANAKVLISAVDNLDDNLLIQ